MVGFFVQKKVVVVYLYLVPLLSKKRVAGAENFHSGHDALVCETGLYAS